MVFNVQSLNKRIDQFIAMLDDHNLQIAFVTETWLTSEANPITSEANPITSEANPITALNLLPLQY